MQLDHTFTVPVSPEEAWSLFLDLEKIAPCMPGAVLDTLEGDTFTGRVKVKVGSVQMSYQGKGTIERDEAARRVVLDLSGSETRGAGTASAAVTATLVPEDGGTRVRVRTDLDITGRPAQFGRGIMAEIGDKLVQQFASRLADLLSRGDRSTAGADSSEAPSFTAEPEAVDLGAAVLPVLLRRAAKPAAALAVVLIAAALRRRRRKR